MLSLRLTCYDMEIGFNDLFKSYEMELGLSDLFTSYEIEVETHVHVQIENQLGFNDLQLHAITRVEKL